MNSTTMHISFKLECDKTYGLESPSFEREEIDYWLNQGTRSFVKTRYSGLNSKKESFEESQKRIDDLRTLVIEDQRTVTETAGTGDYKPNSWTATLPNDYWFALGEEVDIRYNDIRTPNANTNKRQGVTEATVNTYRALIDNPYSEHRLHYEEAKPIRLFLGNTVELITDGDYDILYYYLRYLKKPAEIVYGTVDCDLPEHTHDEIVKTAVRMALENIEQPRYGSFAQEVSVME